MTFFETTKAYKKLQKQNVFSFQFCILCANFRKNWLRNKKKLKI